VGVGGGDEDFVAARGERRPAGGGGLKDRIDAGTGASALRQESASRAPTQRAREPATDDGPDPTAALAAFVTERLARFPNVQATVDRADHDHVAFTVTRCRLIELVHQAGHPDLGPLFCAADARYFGEVEPGVTLDRPTTIAGGHPTCRFILTRVDATPAASEPS